MTTVMMIMKVKMRPSSHIFPHLIVCVLPHGPLVNGLLHPGDVPHTKRLLRIYML
jgi:hypothetical protein